MTKKMDSKWLPLATASILGQAPREIIRKFMLSPGHRGKNER